MAGTLYVVATPVGNLGDITVRAKEVLAEVDEWIVEDSRRSAKLRNELNLPDKPMNQYYDENETRRTPKLIETLESGIDMALMTDAGTPVISDPGYELVTRAREKDLDVKPVPGVSAPVAALSVSGFPADEFMFAGFMPRSNEKRRDKLLEIKNLTLTVIFFEAPHRIRETLKAIRTYLGDRKVFMGREMTKQYEEYVTGTAEDLLEDLDDDTEQGEFTILIHPAEDDHVVPEDYLEELLSKGMKLSDAARITAHYSSETRSDLYQTGLDIQDDLEDQS